MDKKLWLVIILAAFALTVSAASAAFEITSFSCNGQGNPAVVESGSAMNCVARVTNTDSQNSASIGTATLAVSGGWAEQSTYAVVVSDSVLAGGYKDVTFQSIRSITPGDTHSFSYVDIDGSAHTETVSSYRVNALAIKSLTATSSVSSASTSSTFDVSSTVRAGGSFISMTLAIGLSGGCSLVSGQSASKGMGAMSNNAQTSTSWSATQGSSDCAVTVTATGTSSPVTVTSSKSVTVTNPSGGTTTPPPTTSGAGLGGAGGGSGTAAKVYYIGELGLSKVTKQLALGETLKFAILSVNHTIAVKNITKTNATFEIASTPVTATLLVGETKKFDLDGDRTDDVSVTLNRVTDDWNADITLELVNAQTIEKVRKATVIETPTPTAGPQQATGTPTATPASPFRGPEVGGISLTAIVIAVIVLAAVIIFLKRGRKSRRSEGKDAEKPGE